MDNKPSNHLQELREVMAGTSIYIYKSLDGVGIQCDDVARGNHTTILQEHTDSSTVRQHPYEGERLIGYSFDEEKNTVVAKQSNWVVVFVEKFPATSQGIIKEVVIAWCVYSPIDDSSQRDIPQSDKTTSCF